MGDQDNTQQIRYNVVGKDKNFIADLIQSFPPQFKPTNRTGWIAMSLLLFFIIYGIVQAFIPIMDISFDVTKGESLELQVKVGYPFVFFETSENATKIDLSVFSAIIDILIYILIGYIIDILINLMILSMPNQEKREKEKEKPKVLRFKEAQESNSQVKPDQQVSVDPVPQK